MNSKKLTVVPCVFFLACFISQEALATDILTPMVESYQHATTGWFNALQGYAKKLFWLLATIDFAWAVSFLWLKSEMSEVTAALIKKIMTIGFFYSLLLYADTWVPAIIDSFTMAGAKASGLVGGLSPSKVVDLGVELSTVLLSKMREMSLFDSAGAILIAGVSALGILICFALVAVQLTVALIESYIIIGAGVLFLGFGGSQWTRNYSEKYMTYATSAGIKLFVIQLIIGIGFVQAQSWMSLVNTSQETVGLTDIFYTLAGALMLLYISKEIPAIAASALSGTPNLGGGDLIATGVSAAGGAIVGAKMAMNGVGMASRGLPSLMGQGMKAASALSGAGGRAKGQGGGGSGMSGGSPFSNMNNAATSLASGIGKLAAPAVSRLAAKKAATYGKNEGNKN